MGKEYYIIVKMMIKNEKCMKEIGRMTKKKEKE